MNSKFWIFTLAALGLAGPAKTLAQTGSGEHSDAVTTADDQFLKNGGKKVELVEGRSLEFAEQMVENTVAENMAKNQTTEDLVEVDGVGKLNIDELLYLTPEEFINTVRSPGPETDINTVLQLPAQEVQKSMKEAFGRPVRIEIDTVVIHGSDRYELDGKFVGWQSVNSGICYERFNLVKLRYFTAAPEVKNDEGIQKIITAKNDYLIFAFVHETGHANDYLKMSKLSTLNFDQITQLPIHKESVQKLREYVTAQKILLATKSMKRAFPIIWGNFCDAYNANHPGGDADFIFRFDGGKNPAKTSEFREYFSRLEAYVSFLYENQDSIEFTKQKCRALMKSVTETMSQAFYSYICDGQFYEGADFLLRSAIGQVDFLMNNPSAIRFYGKSDFDEMLQSAYSINVNGKIINILDFMPPAEYEEFMRTIVAILDHPELSSGLSLIKKSYKPEIKKMNADQEALFGKRTRQKHDAKSQDFFIEEYLTYGRDMQDR